MISINYRKTLFIILGVIFLLGSIYSVLGFIFIGWVSATPGDHDLNALQIKSIAWLTAIIVCLFASILFFKKS